MRVDQTEPRAVDPLAAATPAVAAIEAGTIPSDLFHDEVPLLTPSLARHGLVDLSSVPPALPRFLIEVTSAYHCTVSNFPC